jgi:hypothetical protein
MAKIALQFIGKTDVSNKQLIEVVTTSSEEIFICIFNREHRETSFITLDLSTAIRFDKELRKQIGLIKNQG